MEVIFLVKNINNKILLTGFFTSLNPIVLKAIEIIRNNCIPYATLDWEKILEDNEKLLDIKYQRKFSKENTMNDVITKLSKINSSKFQPIGQVIDPYNKAIAIILKNKTYIPVLPRGLKPAIPIIDAPKLLKYNETKNLLITINKKTQLNCKPIKKLISSEKRIVGIMLETGRIVPTDISPLVSDSLPISDSYYYPNIDEIIRAGKEEQTEIQQSLLKQSYEEESYQRLRFELSKTLQKDQTAKEHIEKIINNVSEPLNKRRNIMESYIGKLIPTLVSSQTTKSNFNIGTYKKPNSRIRCSKYIKKDNCDKRPHCSWDKSKTCKLHINKINIYNNVDNFRIFIIKISEELLRNKMKRDDILTDNIPDIIDELKFDPSNSEIVLSGSEVMNTIDQLYANKEETVYIDKTLPEYTNPSFAGIDKDKYLDISSNNKGTDFLNLEPLSSHWKIVLGDKYKVYKYISNDNSLYYAIIKALKDVKGSQSYTIRTIKQNIAEYVNKIPRALLIKVIDALECKERICIDLSTSQQSWEILLTIYSYYNPVIFNTDMDLSEFRNKLISNEHSGTLLDIYLVSIYYKYNIMVLDKRIVKSNPLGLRCIGPSMIKTSKYILLYFSKINESNIYDIIESNNNYIFNINELPKLFRKVIIKQCDKCSIAVNNMNRVNNNNNNIVNNNSNNNKPRKCKARISMKPKSKTKTKTKTKSKTKSKIKIKVKSKSKTK